MAGTTNYDRVGKALDLLRHGLAPFIAQELAATPDIKDKWRDVLVEMSQHPEETEKAIAHNEALDVHLLLNVMWKKWNEVFRRTLGHAERSLVSELMEFRNRWAHQEQFSTDDAYRCLDSTERLLTSVSAPEAEKVSNDKMRLMRERFQQELRDERKKQLPGLEGEPVASLKPWREVVTPHEDVTSGGFMQAEFAADLWQVYRGTAKTEYGDAVHFFRRTYMTDGLKILLGNALNRICGDGGDPIVELQTNFGGGKTHSMLALFHLFSGTPFAEMAGVEELTQQAGISDKRMSLHRAALVGTRIAPGQPGTKDDGTVINTLWGELAWQLGGREAYDMVRQADENGSGPGEALHNLIDKYSPCLILIDEWVAYARQLHDT